MAQWLQCWMPDSGGRLSFGFHNPNHAAAEGRAVGTQRFWNKMFFSSGSDDVFFYVSR